MKQPLGYQLSNNWERISPTLTKQRTEERSDDTSTSEAQNNNTKPASHLRLSVLLESVYEALLAHALEESGLRALMKDGITRIINGHLPPRSPCRSERNNRHQTCSSHFNAPY